MGGGVESGVEEMDLPHSCAVFSVFLVDLQHLWSCIFWSIVSDILGRFFCLHCLYLLFSAFYTYRAFLFGF
jgi:hypothetical protein